MDRNKVDFDQQLAQLSATISKDMTCLPARIGDHILQDLTVDGLVPLTATQLTAQLTDSMAMILDWFDILPQNVLQPNTAATTATESTLSLVFGCDTFARDGYLACLTPAGVVLSTNINTAKAWVTWNLSSVHIHGDQIFRIQPFKASRDLAKKGAEVFSKLKFFMGLLPVSTSSREDAASHTKFQDAFLALCAHAYDEGKVPDVANTRA
jgi:hypothetical protein